MEQEQVIKIDIDAVLRERAGRYYRFVPTCAIRWLERTICQDRLNWLLDHNKGKSGAAFCHGVLDDLNIKINIVDEANLPPKDDRRVVIVSNHPLGGLDGMALIDYFTNRYGGRVLFVVNDLLMAIKPLSSVFLPINKIGKQSRQASHAVDEAFAGDDPIIIFPAGLVSRRSKNGGIADLQWHKMFVNKSVEHRRNVIPLFFSGKNSSFFYNFAKFRTRVGLKFNIEMIYLPKEVFRSENSEYSIYMGKPIRWEDLATGKDAQRQTEKIRSIVYSLPQSCDKALA